MDIMGCAFTGTCTKTFELAAILDWYDVNRGNIVFQFYLKAY